MFSQPEEGEKVLDSQGLPAAQGPRRLRQCAWWQCSVSGGPSVNEEIRSNEAGKEAGSRSPRASVSCQRGDTILTQGRGRGHRGWRKGGRGSRSYYRCGGAVLIPPISSPYGRKLWLRSLGGPSEIVAELGSSGYLCPKFPQFPSPLNEMPLIQRQLLSA